MKICYWGTFEREYPRNAVLIAGLRQNGVEVIECHYELWEQAFRSNKMALLAGFGRKLRLAVRAFLNYPILIYRYLCVGDHDAVIVGYLGHLDIFFLMPFAKLKRKLLVFDAFFSLYDTAILDWQLGSKNSLLARLCRFLDWGACRSASLVLVDTEAQQKFFCREFGLASEKVRWLYVGADDSMFTPSIEPDRPRPFRILYVGNHVPLHGIPVILQAARLLNEEKIEFWLVGGNHKDPDRTELSRHSNGACVKWFPWMPPHELRDKIREVDVCLGIFGTSDKARRVIPGKAFLALAMGKPLITGDSPAARELLEHGKNAILCEMGSADALADAIRRLRNDPLLRQRIGKEGGRLYQKQCRPAVLGLRLARLIQDTLKRKEPGSIETCERHHT
jgi:glycosyltransferase involved in cell wall biosynthesis